MFLLPSQDYPVALTQLNTVDINHYFAKSVLVGHSKGKVYVDNLERPKNFYIICHYGMSLVYSQPVNKGFVNKLAQHMTLNNQNHQQQEWLQAYPDNWHQALAVATKSQQLPAMEKQTRVNFEFSPELFSQVKRPDDLQLVEPMTIPHFNQIEGDVAPKHFWLSSEKFAAKGKGFVTCINNKVVSAAYSSCIDKGILEIGIESDANYRNKGYAYLVCFKLISYCLENNLIPVWACRHENTASFNLAQKLGFKPTKFLPYYPLKQG